MFRRSALLWMLLPAVAGCAPRTPRPTTYASPPVDSVQAAEPDVIAPPPVAAPSLDVAPPPPVGEDGMLPVTVNNLSQPPGKTFAAPPVAQTVASADPAPAGVPDNGEVTAAPGDTVYSLARRYRTSPQALIRANNMTAPYALNVGQRVRIPGAEAGRDVSADLPAEVDPTQTGTIASITERLNLPSPLDEGTPATSDSADAEASPAVGASGRLSPPVEGGGVKADYGQTYRGKPTNGIVYATYEDAPVRAAAAGRVVYVGEAAGYGQVVLIRHDDGLLTNYGYLKKILTAQGKRVSSGEVIARAGKSPGSTQAAVMFEVRKGAEAQNPNRYLGEGA